MSLFGLADTVLGIVDKFVVDSDKELDREIEREKMKKEIELVIQNQEHKVQIEQIKTNQLEAQHTSKFVSGWRPGLGWVCVTAIAYNFILQPLLSFIAVVMFSYNGEIPIIEIEYIISLVTILLGAVGSRSFDKRQILKNKGK